MSPCPIQWPPSSLWLGRWRISGAPSQRTSLSATRLWAFIILPETLCLLWRSCSRQRRPSSSSTASQFLTLLCGLRRFRRPLSWSRWHEQCSGWLSMYFLLLHDGGWCWWFFCSRIKVGGSRYGSWILMYEYVLRAPHHHVTIGTCPYWIMDNRTRGKYSSRIVMIDQNSIFGWMSSLIAFITLNSVGTARFRPLASCATCWGLFYIPRSGHLISVGGSSIIDIMQITRLWSATKCTLS